MLTKQLNSSFIVSASYDQDKQQLTILFGVGSSCTYADVPKTIYDGLVNAESHGKYFHANIKGKYEFKKDRVKRSIV